MGWRPTGEILACLKSPIPHCPAPRPSLPFSSPSSISAERKDRWQREGLAGSLRSLLSYFHKPIIAHHLGRLRPCLSPIQPGGRGRGERGVGRLGGPLLLHRHHDLRLHPVAMGTLSWSCAGLELGCGAWRLEEHIAAPFCTQGGGRELRSKLKVLMRCKLSKGRASEKEGPAGGT